MNVDRWLALGIALAACSSPSPRTGAVGAPAGDAGVVALDASAAGELVVRFPDGTVEVRGRVLAGVLDGAWQRFHPGGALAEEGRYVAGKKEGVWRQLAADGRELARYEMIAGTGTELVAWDDGSVRLEIGWTDGVRDGAAVARDAAGAIVVDETWKLGVLDGARTIGKAKQGPHLVETWQDGVRTGARIVSWKGHPVIEEQYDEAGRLHGPWIAWRGKGRKREEGTYRHGQRHGAWTWYDRSGAASRTGRYLDGLRDGTWIEYGAKGRELGRYTMRRGTGTVIEWHASGKKARSSRFVAGVPTARAAAGPRTAR